MNNLATTVAMPFGVDRQISTPAGLSIERILQKMGYALDSVVVYIRAAKGAKYQWENVTRDKWRYIRPKQGGALKIEFTPQGGKSGNIFALIASVVIAIAAPYLAGLVFAKSTVGFFLASAAITIGGNLLVQSLFPPPQPAQTNSAEAAENDSAEIADVDSDNNILAKGKRLPRIMGTRRVSPPDVCQPYRYLKDGVEIIERLFAFEGEHEISEVRVAGTAIESIPNSEFQIVSGAQGSGIQNIVRKISKTNVIREQLNGFSVKSGSNNVSNQPDPENSEPSSVVFSSGYHERMEEIAVRFRLSAFAVTDTKADKASLPLRISFWPKSDPSSIHNLPEIHISGRVLNDNLKEFRFRWDRSFNVTASSSDYSFAFFKEVPATSDILSDESTGVQWEASSHFQDGDSIGDVQNISPVRDGIIITLDEDLFPKEEYEFKIVAGAAYESKEFNVKNYQYKDNVLSFFKARLVSGQYKIPISQSDLSAGMSVEFSTMVVNLRPVQLPGIAQLAVRLSNVDAKNVTCLVGSVIQDYNGSDWSERRVTENPASHYRSVLREWLEHYPVDFDLIADDELEAWHGECETKGYKVALVATGQSISDTLSGIAVAGFATKRFGTGYGVDHFRDRTSEIPQMVFSPRNSKISFERTWQDLPKGYRVQFRNEENDYADDEVFINHPYGAATFTENETKQYSSISDPDLIKRRAIFDMLQQAYRPVTWQVRAGPETFNRKRGDLIGIITDLDSDNVHGFRVRDVVDSKTIVVDRPVPVEGTGALFTSDDVFQESNIFTVGQTSIAYVQTRTGIEQHFVESAGGNVLKLETDLSETDIVGTSVSISPNGGEMKRCFVLDVRREDKQRGTITVVEEAPEIFEEMERFVA